MPITNNATGNYQNSRFIVGTGINTYLTVQSAINAAYSAGGNSTVYLRPGTYTENLTLHSTVNLEGVDSTLVTLIGTHTPPSSGSITITKIGLQSAGNILNSYSSGTCNIIFSQCLFNCNGYVIYLPSWTGTLQLTYCTENPLSVRNGIIYNTSGSKVVIIFSNIGADETNFMRLSGTTTIQSTYIRCPTNISGSAVASIFGGCYFANQIYIQDTAQVRVSNSTVSHSTRAAIYTKSSAPATFDLVILDSSGSLVIDGTGSVVLNCVVFPNTVTINPTVTVTIGSQVNAAVYNT